MTMDDFRLDVFVAVAQNQSFTKAANELHISQPAVSQHIRELEGLYGVQLFERSKNSVTLTKQGEVFYSYAIEILGKYRELRFEMNLMGQHDIGSLSVAASTTISQYVLPGIMAEFMARFPDIKLSLVSGNSDFVEQMVQENRVDLGLVEGGDKKTDFSYSVFARDELVLITSTKNKCPDEVTIDELRRLPLVLRENGSGTLGVIQKYLKELGFKLSDLNVQIQLGSTESIKRFITNGNYYAIVSIAAITHEVESNIFRVVEVDGSRIFRNFSFITRSGQQNRLSDKFAAFAVMYHKKKL